jgi:hypothetical protein
LFLVMPAMTAVRMTSVAAGGGCGSPVPLDAFRIGFVVKISVLTRNLPAHRDVSSL